MMRAPLLWLADYVAIELPARDLARRLTLAGIKVEAVDEVGADWQDVVVGQVTAIEPHPSSKKPLWVAEVKTGDRMQTVVTGAQNVRLGDKVPLVPVGSVLPHGPDGEPMVIQARPMAGITSHGMLASARELGISDEHEGIYILPADTPPGVPLRTVLGDDILDIETNPNRPDTLSEIGIAREVAAVTEQQLTLPDLDEITGAVTRLDEDSIPVEVLDPDLCPRYSALRIEGVRVQPSPWWMAQRLQAAGMRPINLIVDITNYVMLEYGQPMHAFDARDLQGGRIVVRRAHEGEQLTTLDGVRRTLTPDSLVIADGERAVAVAGVMGGENSEIKDDTTAIVLESATFDAVSVRRTAKMLGLRTESSSRFEKDLPPEQTLLGIQRFLQLLAQTSAQPLRVARVTDVLARAPEERVVRMPLRDLDRLLGLPVAADTAAEALSLLGFDVTLSDGSIDARVPFWRRADIQESADLVEEVARIVGYETITDTLPRRTLPPSPPSPELRWRGVARERLRAAGANEVETNTLTSVPAMARLFTSVPARAELDSDGLWQKVVANPAGVYEREALVAPIHLRNAPTTDRDTLRLTLIPELLTVVSRNLRHTYRCLAFFEIAHTYFPRPQDLPYERWTLGLALSGSRQPHSWQEASPGPRTFYDVKGMVESVLEALQIGGWAVEPKEHPALHPGRSAVVTVGGHRIGYLGELHPAIAERFEIEDWPVQVAELDLDSLFPLATDLHTFHPVPRFPAARRDIAVLVRRELPAADVLRVVRAAGGELLQGAEIFDVYEGRPLPADRKSIAVAMELRSPGGTLTQDEITEVVSQVVAALSSELGGELRE